MISVEKKTYSLNSKLDFLKSCKKSIFIQGNGLNGEHYYYLINFADDYVMCWTVDISEAKEKLIKSVEKNSQVEWVGYAKNFLDFSLMPHTSIYNKGKIFTTAINGNYMIGLHVTDDSYDVICDTEEGFDKILSSTNSIYNDELYFTRYSLEDKILILNYEDRLIENEICKYNLHEKKFSKINSFKSTITMHQTSVSPDGKNITSVGICTAPVIRFPRNLKYLSDQEFMLTILKGGLKESCVVNYNVDQGKFYDLSTSDCVAHLEFDAKDKNIAYISAHNLGYNGGVFGNDIYSFGPGSIYKYNIKTNEVIGKYTAEDFIRLTCHQSFTYKGRSLLAVTVYPSQIHIIDTDTMQIYKKIFVSKTKSVVDFSKGPYNFPKMGKTPYTVLTVDESPYLFYGGLTGIKIYDYMKDEILGTINYNVNSKPLTAIGHPIIFDIDKYFY